MIKACSRKKLKTREEWLSARQAGIGASEAAAVVGLSPWLSNVELWEQKTGLKQPKDLQDNELVRQGKAVEPALRELFTALYGESVKVSYNEFDMLFQEDTPWLFATLDGELYEKESGIYGVLEIKTNTPQNRAAWEQWDGKIPTPYYVQVLHQMLATGADFVIVIAALFKRNGEIVIKSPYRIERADVLEDLEWLYQQEKAFWNDVQERKMPGIIINV